MRPAARMRPVACAAALVAVGLAADPARADDPIAREARSRFAEGLQRYGARDFEAARAAFLQAYALVPAVDVLYNLAMSELRGEHPVEALAHLRAYAADPRTRDDERARAARFMDEAALRTGHLTFGPAPGADATLSIDGDPRSWPAANEAIDVTAGNHVVARRVGSENPHALSVDAAPGLVTPVVWPEPALPLGVGQAMPNDDAALFHARVSGADLAHDEDPHADLVSPRPFVTAGLVVAATVAAGFGTAFLADRVHQIDRVNTLRATGIQCNAPSPPECSRFAAARETYDADKTRAIVLFGAAAALGLGAIATWTLWPREDGTPRVRAGVGPASVSAALTF
jgi:hypothetical protein